MARPRRGAELHLFGQLKRITRQWLDDHLDCKGGTYPAQLIYQELADMACERITAGIVSNLLGERPIKAMLDPYNPVGSTLHVRFTTSKKLRWETDPGRCHINWVVCGRWAFAELADVSAMEADFEGVLKAQFQALVERVTS